MEVFPYFMRSFWQTHGADQEAADLFHYSGHLATFMLIHIFRHFKGEWASTWSAKAPDPFQDTCTLHYTLTTDWPFHPVSPQPIRALITKHTHQISVHYWATDINKGNMHSCLCFHLKYIFKKMNTDEVHLSSVMIIACQPGSMCQPAPWHWLSVERAAVVRWALLLTILVLPCAACSSSQVIWSMQNKGLLHYNFWLGNSFS